MMQCFLWYGVITLSLHSLIVSTSPTRNGDATAQVVSCQNFNLGVPGLKQLYNMTYAPNPLFPEYLPSVDRAVSEVGLVLSQTIIRNCSKHTEEFLLYAYLPQCFSFQTVTLLVFPCVTFCQRIRSCCERALFENSGIQWPEWLNCDKIATPISSNQNICYSPPSYSSDHCVPSPPPPEMTGAPSATTGANAVPSTTPKDLLATSSGTEASADPSNSSPARCSYFKFSPWSDTYYNATYSPNPLSPAYLPTAEAAALQASLVFPLALATKCSKHIGEFLLYSFFPQCYLARPPSTYRAVLPCEDFCEVVKNCCSSALANYNVSWPEWLNCAAMGAATPAGSQGVCFRPSGLGGSGPTCADPSTQIPTVSPTTLPSTASPPTPPPPPCYCNSTCDACVIRSAVTSATFTVSNFNYHFAAKVTINSKRVEACNTTYRVTVLETHLPCPNSPIPQLPPSNAEITTYTQPCSSCIDLSVGQTYWVGGVYYVNCRGQPVWEIPRIKGVAALWVEKYDQKGPTWVQVAKSEHGC